MVTTAGITRLIRSSSESDASALTGGMSASGGSAVRSSGAALATGSAAGGLGADRKGDGAVETGTAIGSDETACPPSIHHTAPEKAASATAISVADWRSAEGPESTTNGAAAAGFGPALPAG
jgi:hypothetical protein